MSLEAAPWNPEKFENFKTQADRNDQRLYLLRLRTRLLCRECGDVKAVTDFKTGEKVAVLECGHERSPHTEMKRDDIAALAKYVENDIERSLADAGIEQIQNESEIVFVKPLVVFDDDPQSDAEIEQAA